jgi:hypothetical protein
VVYSLVSLARGLQKDPKILDGFFLADVLVQAPRTQTTIEILRLAFRSAG